MLMSILTIGIVKAQNANRSGFFMELGIGGLVGNTPRSSLSIADNIVYYKCVSGAAVDFGMGARFKTSNHWAYEFKAEGQIPLSNPANALVGRLLPVGFRYTSGELWRNYSIFVHLNIGGAITVCNGMVGRDNLRMNASEANKISDIILSESSAAEVLYPDTPEMKIKGYVGLEGYGVAYSAGIGINLTTHLYVEGCFNAQAMFNCFGKNGKETLNYGIAALILGYRF